jgi:hypothetical protein
LEPWYSDLMSSIRDEVARRNRIREEASLALLDPDVETARLEKAAKESAFYSWVHEHRDLYNQLWSEFGGNRQGLNVFSKMAVHSRVWGIMRGIYERGISET